MAPKRVYARISVETRTRIVKAFEAGEDWKLVANLNGVNYKTAYTWVHADIPSYTQKRRGGNRKPILNENEIEEMLQWVSDDPPITLKSLRLRMKAYSNKDASTTTISRYLDCRLITTKKLWYIPVGTNTLENKPEAVAYDMTTKIIRS